MHDTAFQIGTLAMNIYADLRSASILEIGSQSLNGSLRENALSTTKYLGVDIEQGDGVDIVVEAGKPIPVEDASFDFVMASSVFEHDPCFWMTFLEMCRVTKDGGYIYINAPSNGVVHRYPQDNWRFYPDSGRALVQWAVSQGQHASLIESFTADRQDDLWNDFVAVFRKGRITKALPKVFLHEHIPSSNVITWKSKKIINPRDETEDMVLLAEAARQHDSLAEQVTQLNAKLAEAADQVERHRVEIQSLVVRLAGSEQLHDKLQLRESELRQRQEEIEQTRSELDKGRSERDDLRSRLTGLEQRLTEWSIRYDQGQAKLKVAWAAAEASEAKLSERSQELVRITELLRTRETELNTEKAAAEVRLGERFQEIATLSSMLAEREAQARRSSEEAAWLMEVTSVLANGSTTPKGRLLALLPASLQQKRHRKTLKRIGLFDGEAYLAANPDVAAEGEDPLDHYLRHGIRERRRRA